jgi:hypothetical protein
VLSYDDCVCVGSALGSEGIDLQCHVFCAGWADVLAIVVDGGGSGNLESWGITRYQD